jgi:SET domain-containing protein
MKLLLLLVLFIILINIFNNYPNKDKSNITVINSDKGRSVIATKNIKKNTLLFVDTVTYHSEDYFEIIYNILNSNDKGGRNAKELITKYFNLVPHTIDDQFISREEILKKLNNSRYKEYFRNMEIDEVRILYEKLNRNMFLFNEDYKVEEGGLFIDSIYFNHSCIPNVEYDIINDKIYFHTVRDISKGEEIYISYIDTSKETSERKKELLKGYGFECNCELCNFNY